jgi:hypothetical protein
MSPRPAPPDPERDERGADWIDDAACVVDDDLFRDVTGVLTSFCARLYSRRSFRNRAEKALHTFPPGQGASTCIVLVKTVVKIPGQVRMVGELYGQAHG